MVRKHKNKIDLEVIKKRVELKRESIYHSKYTIPYDNFLEIIESAAKLLDFVMERTRKIKKEKENFNLRLRNTL